MMKLTDNDILIASQIHNIPFAALKAVNEIEAKGSGFLKTGEPVILFERHVFWRLLGENNYFTLRKHIRSKYPRICNRFSGGYGKYRDQHKKLQIASDYNRECALESCSWGLGQVMGYHWKDLGYPSLQHFINDMYESEAKQLEAMIRFIKRNGLDGYLRNQQWAKFAYRYNGKAFRRFGYARKLKKAYARYV